MTLTDAGGERSIADVAGAKKEQMVEAVQEIKQECAGRGKIWRILMTWTLSSMRAGRMFQGVHTTVTGDSHIQKGIVCQDSAGVYVTDSFAIAVAADGHGSAKHFRSDAGSRIAVKITVELLKNYMSRADFREQFRAHPEFILSQMEKQILMKWREAVEEYHLENPLTEEEEQKQATAGGKLRTAVIYGSTVLAAVIADGFSSGWCWATAVLWCWMRRDTFFITRWRIRIPTPTIRRHSAIPTRYISSNTGIRRSPGEGAVRFHRRAVQILRQRGRFSEISRSAVTDVR